MLIWAVEKQSGPVAIRYPRGSDRGYADSAWNTESSVVCHRQGDDVTLITYGVLLDNAMKAAELLSEQGTEATVLRLTKLTDISVNEIVQSLSANKQVFVLEEVGGHCGIGAEIAAKIQNGNVHCIDLGDQYVTHGAIDILYEHYGLSPEAIKNYVMEVHRDEN